MLDVSLLDEVNSLRVILFLSFGQIRTFILSLCSLDFKNVL